MNSELASVFPGTVSNDLDVSTGRKSHSEPSVRPQSSLAEVTSIDRIECPADEVLFEELRTGNKEALAILFRRYARLVRAVAYRILRDGAEADDLVQETFLFIYRKESLFDAARGSARSWIVQVAYHRAIDRRRYLASRHFYNHLELSDTALTSGRFYDQSIEGMLGREKLREIDEALSEDQRQTLQLYFYEGYTLEEISKEMAQTVGNIRNHYYRGLEKMRQGIFGATFRTK